MGLASYYTPSAVEGAYHYVVTAEFSRLNDTISAYPSAAVEPPATGSEEVSGSGEATPGTQPEGEAGAVDNPKDSGTAATEGEGASSTGNTEGSGTTIAPAGDSEGAQADGGSSTLGSTAGASEGSSTGSQTSDNKESSSEGGASSPSYTVVEGANQVVTLGSTSPVVFKSNGEFDEFASLKLDGTTVDPSNYSAKRGSVIVELKKAFADKLSVGEHSLSFVFKNGVESSTKFTVKAASSNATATSDATASAGSATKPHTNTSQAIKPQADAQSTHNKEQDTAKTEEKPVAAEENNPAVVEEAKAQTQEEASVAAAVAKKEDPKGAVLPQTSDTSFASLYFAGALACMSLCIALGLRRRA